MSVKGLVADHIKSLPKSGIRRFFDLVNTMDDVISLGVGEPDFVTPWTIRETGIFFSGKRSYQLYFESWNAGAAPGSLPLCARQLSRFPYRPEDECIITIGVSEALDIAMRALLDPGDEVLYTEPCFVSYPAEVRMAHGIPVPIETKVEDAFALDPGRAAPEDHTADQGASAEFSMQSDRGCDAAGKPERGRCDCDGTRSCGHHR